MTDSANLPATVPDYDHIREVFAAAHDGFLAASPFPHAVFDGLLPAAMLDAVRAEFPDPEAMSIHFENEYERKSAESTWERFGPAMRRAVAELNSGAFLTSLESLTGIEHLVADMQLYGGGMHQITTGGRLEVHADFTRHRNGLDRRLNVIVYLNHDWDDAWGGELQLWSRDQRQLVERVSPQFGRMVIFETAADTFHGHPEQLRTPPGVNRRSIAFYYYSNGRPDPVPQRNTRWLADPDAPVPFKERVKESLPGPVVSAVKKVKGRLTP